MDNTNSNKQCINTILNIYPLSCNLSDSKSKKRKRYR